MAYPFTNTLQSGDPVAKIRADDLQTIHNILNDIEGEGGIYVEKTPSGYGWKIRFDGVGGTLGDSSAADVSNHTNLTYTADDHDGVTDTVAKYIEAGGTAARNDMTGVIGDSSAVQSIDPGARELTDTAGTKTFDWQLGQAYYNDGTTASLDYITGQAKDSDNVSSISWTGAIGGRGLLDTAAVFSVQWGNRILSDSDATDALDWANRELDATTGASLDWENRTTADSNAVQSIDWNNRQLTDSDAKASLQWHTRFLSDSNAAAAIDYGSRLLHRDSVNVSADWANHRLYSASDTSVSIDYGTRKLRDSDEGNVAEWDTQDFRVLSGYVYGHNTFDGATDTTLGVSGGIVFNPNLLAAAPAVDSLSVDLNASSEIQIYKWDSAVSAGTPAATDLVALNVGGNGGALAYTSVDEFITKVETDFDPATIVPPTVWLDDVSVNKNGDSEIQINDFATASSVAPSDTDLIPYKDLDGAPADVKWVSVGALVGGAGQQWIQDSDYLQNYGASIGNTGGTNLVIDLDNLELENGTWTVTAGSFDITGGGTYNHSGTVGATAGTEVSGGIVVGSPSIKSVGDLDPTDKVLVW